MFFILNQNDFDLKLISCILLGYYFLNFDVLCSEKEQQEAIEHIDEVQNEIDRWVWTRRVVMETVYCSDTLIVFQIKRTGQWRNFKSRAEVQ